MILLYNYWAETVGLNQIRTVYMPHLQKKAEDLFGYYVNTITKYGYINEH